jgi:hypothetical protein
MAIFGCHIVVNCRESALQWDPFYVGVDENVYIAIKLIQSINLPCQIAQSIWAMPISDMDTQIYVSRCRQWVNAVKITVWHVNGKSPTTRDKMTVRHQSYLAAKGGR